MRKTAGCLNCGEVREIAAHGLCFACYRRHERAQERPPIDRHTPAIRREHKKILRGFTSVMSGLSDLGVGKSDTARIRRIVDPYLEPIAEFLAPPQGVAESREPVNGERISDRVFTGGDPHRKEEAE